MHWGPVFDYFEVYLGAGSWLGLKMWVSKVGNLGPLDVLFLKGDHNLLRLQWQTYSLRKYVLAHDNTIAINYFKIFV